MLHVKNWRLVFLGRIFLFNSFAIISSIRIGDVGVYWLQQDLPRHGKLLWYMNIKSPDPFWLRKWALEMQICSLSLSVSLWYLWILEKQFIFWSVLFVWAMCTLSLYCRLFWALSSQSFLLGFLTPLLLGSSLSFINFTRVILSWGMTIDHEHELDKSPLVFYVHLFHNFTISWDTPVRIQGGISMAYTQFKISDLQYARFPFVPGCRMREEIQYEVVSTLDSSSPRWIKDCWWL